VLYESCPTALRFRSGAIVLERRRRTRIGKQIECADDLVSLAILDGDELAAQAGEIGFVRLASRWVPPTADQVGSEIVMLSKPAVLP
jgi:hypothetical protein